MFVQAWYQGGLAVIDFTDSANPFEIAFFDRGPVSTEKLITDGFWSAYYYDGRIYGSEITRGLDVLALQSSDFITTNEVSAAALAVNGAVFNPQQQFARTWPDTPAVAAAYVDQLARNGTLEAGLTSELRAALDAAKTAMDQPASAVDKAALASRLEALSSGVASASDAGGPTSERQAALSAMLTALAARLR